MRGYGGAFSSTPLVLALLRCLLCASLLIVPTTFMGATLPILSRALVQTGPDFAGLGGKIALLYAANTAGALSGAFAAGFWLLPALGLASLHWLAVVGALFVAIGGVLLARWRNISPPVRREQAQGLRPKPSMDARFALAAFAISGAISMVLQALFSRVLALVLGSAIQSFSLVLVMFLFGLSAGAAVMGRIASRSLVPIAWLGVGLTCAAAALLQVYSWVDVLPAFHHGLVRSSGVALDSTGGVFVRALVAAAIVPVTFFLGAVMPLAVQAYTRSEASVGRDVGRAYAVNTIGAVCGSIVGGFFVLPGLGIGGGISICALVLLATSVMLSFRPQPRHIRWANRGAIAALLVAFVLMPQIEQRRLTEGMFQFLHMDKEDWNTFATKNKLVYLRDGRASTISVFQSGRSLALLNNGKPDGSSHEDVDTQVLLGLIPAVLHPGGDTTAFVIGYGTGMTVGSLTQAAMFAVDTVEIEQAVYEAADRFLAPIPTLQRKNPQVHRYLETDAISYRRGSKPMA